MTTERHSAQVHENVITRERSISCPCGWGVVISMKVDDPEAEANRLWSEHLSYPVEATTLGVMTTPTVDPAHEDFDRPSTPSTIRTYTGAYVDILEPSPRDIDIRDIAHALSMVCRYGGHVNRHYSVAEHSYLVAQHVWRKYGDQKLALAALLHDSAEAYLGDMVNPMKRGTPAGEHYRVIEERWECAIELAYAELLDGYRLDDPRIKAVDKEIVDWEQTMIRDTAFPDVGPSHAQVEDAFLSAFYAYGHMEA